MSVDVSWFVTGDFLRKNCVLIVTLDDDVAENAVAKTESLKDNALAKMSKLRWSLAKAPSKSVNSFHCEIGEEGC
jgi:hypothetical protein